MSGDYIGNKSAKALYDAYTKAQADDILKENIKTSGRWLSYGGSANAVSLTSDNESLPVTAYVDGAQYRFRATTTNGSGGTTISIDGLVDVPCVTVTGVALPEGYIRTTADTVFRYDAINTRMIVDRMAEIGSNANGKFTKYSSGKMVCLIFGLSMDLDSDVTWTYPSEFVEAPVITGIGQVLDRVLTIGASAANSTGAPLRGYFITDSGRTAGSFNVIAEGIWY